MKSLSVKKEYMIIFLLFLLLWSTLSIYTQTIHSGFQLTDDYIILQIKNSIEKNGLLNTLITYITPEFSQRLRPLYTPFKILRTVVFGDNYSLWSLHLLISAVISSFLFYLFARLINFSIFESALFSIFSLMGYQAIIWFHLCYDETLGIILLSFALFFLAMSVYKERHQRLFSSLFTLFTILTAMCKEPFILLIPAMIYLKHQIISQKLNIPILKSLKKDYQSFALLLIFFISIIYLKFGLQTIDFGYCGLSGFDPIGYIKSFLSLSSLSHGMNYIILTIALFCCFPKKHSIMVKFFRENAHIFMVFLLIILPQCIIYTKSGFYARYLIPALIGYSYLTVNLLRFFRTNIKSKVMFIIVYFLVILSVISISIETIRTTKYYANKGIAAQSVLNLINNKVESDNKILIAGDITMNFEQTQAFKNYLELQKNKKTNIYFYPLILSNPSKLSPFETKLISQFKNSYNDKIQNNIDKNISAIIVFKNVYENFLFKNKKYLDDFTLYDYNNFKVYIKN